MKQPRKKITKDTALQRLAALCARQEVCEQEARHKMMLWGLEGEEAEQVLDHLIAGRFIDEDRYARAFANDKVKFSGWGRLKVRKGLIAKGISSRVVDAALRDIDHEAYDKAVTKAARALSRGMDLTQYAQRSRLHHKMLSRGFESALIVPAIDILHREQLLEDNI